MRPLLFATTSPYKKALLQHLGLSADWAAPVYIEGDVADLDPEHWAEHHARGKAESLVSSFPGHLVVGLDQTLVVAGQVLHKPGTLEKALDQLQFLSGKTHQLHTAFALAGKGLTTQSATVTAHMQVLPHLQAEFLRQLIERDQSWDCAGSYKIERGASLIMEKISCEDPNAIIGVPMLALIKALSQRGYFAQRQA